MPVCFQWTAGLAASLLISGCACGAGAPPLTPPSEAAVPIGRNQLVGGVKIFRTGLDGNTFTAVLPVRSQLLDLGPLEVLERIGPVLAAVGFQRSLTDLAIPVRPLVREAPDLKSLAVEICREPVLLESPGSRAVCGALIEGGPSTLADEAIRSAYGMSFADWKADLQRPFLEYSFAQVVAGVPIESAGIFVVRRPGESTSLIYGSLFNLYSLINQVDTGAREVVLGAALARLAREMKGTLALLPMAPTLVLIPDGAVTAPDGTPVPALRYAWRVLVGRQEGAESWMAWFDAASGNLLRMSDQAKDATEVAGVRWRRDPGPCSSGKTCTESVRFYIDPAKNGKLALQLNGVFQRIEVPSQPYLELDDPKKLGFNQSPANDAMNAVCASQNNSAFRQVNAYSHLYSFWNMVNSAKPGQTFPENPLRVVVDDPDPGMVGSSAYYDSQGKDAQSSLWLSAGPGFTSSNCPKTRGVRLNGAQDATVMAHEMTHLLVQRLQERRQCNSPCPMPDVLGHNILHDFADGLAALYASTNCFAGWSAKNMGEIDATLNCKGNTSEAGGFPRLASLPMDSFPKLDKGEYANGQIAAAGLWEVRKGMRSKSLAGGTMEAWIRTLRALGNFGFLPHTCQSTKAVWQPASQRFRYDSCDRDVFLYLQDLEAKMVGAWLAGGEPTKQAASKVLSGWAKAGVFLVPYKCLDGKAGTRDALSCSDKDTALDAVIEIDDKNAGDDPKDVDGVVHPEVDYLNKTTPPRFRVWTGPAYSFPTETVSTATQCGSLYEIEVASDAKFQTDSWKSGPQTSSKPCEGEFDLSGRLPDETWRVIAAKGTLYYRVRTWDSSGHTRISTEPGAGAFTIPPPFAVINATGKP